MACTRFARQFSFALSLFSRLSSIIMTFMLQVLPASDNWMWTLATDPRLLDMLEAHLVGALTSSLEQDVNGPSAVVSVGEDGLVSDEVLMLSSLTPSSSHPQGPNLVLFSTQLAVKPPGTGSTVPWHQDGERCRSVWICLVGR